MHQSTTRIIPPETTIAAVLNDLLAHEIGAADIYDACSADVPSSLSLAIESCQDSHVRRSALLRHAIVERNGEPTARADFWGSITAVLMEGARLLGTKAILALLVKGEEETVDAYRAALDRLDMPSGEWLRRHCIPEQTRTLRTIAELHQMAPS